MSGLGFGIIELGEVAQLMRLSTLNRLPDRFAVTSVTDISPSVGERVTARWRVAGVHASADAERLAGTARDANHIRNLPMRLEIQETTDATNVWTILGPYYKDPFELELEALHAAVMRGGENRTPVSDSHTDFDIFAAFITHLRPGQVAS